MFLPLSLQHHNLQDGFTTVYTTGATVLNYKQMDFSDISSDFPDIMMKVSGDDIPDLLDISECLDNIQHEVWYAKIFLLTPPKITKIMMYKDVYPKHV